MIEVMCVLNICIWECDTQCMSYVHVYACMFYKVKIRSSIPLWLDEWNVFRRRKVLRTCMRV